MKIVEEDLNTIIESYNWDEHNNVFKNNIELNKDADTAYCIWLYSAIASFIAGIVLMTVKVNQQYSIPFIILGIILVCISMFEIVHYYKGYKIKRYAVKHREDIFAGLVFQSLIVGYGDSMYGIFVVTFKKNSEWIKDEIRFKGGLPFGNWVGEIMPLINIKGKVYGTFVEPIEPFSTWESTNT